MSRDFARTQEDWFNQSDPGRAVAESREFMEAVRDGRIDPVPELDYLELAAEPLWDGPDGDPDLVLQAVGASQRTFRAAERFGGLKDPLRLYARARPQVLLARSQHRAERYREALMTSLDLLRWLEDFAGGRSALLDVLSRAVPNLSTELTVAALGIYPAALRRAVAPGTVRYQYTELGLPLVESYVLARPEPTVYARTHALASQWMYLLIERGAPEDTDLISQLYELDVRSRPDNVRGQATRALRDMEFARHQGDATEAERCRDQAITDLSALPLARHQRIVEARGYLAG